jgi:hypothetical protein
MTTQDRLARAIEACFISPNVADRNVEAANIVDALDRVASSLFALSGSIDRLVTDKGQEEE